MNDMPQEQSASLKNKGWEAQTLRITNFILLGTPIVDAQAWWAEVVGREPEEVLSRPGSGQIQQIGDFQGQKLALVVKPDRIDLQMLRGLTPLEELEDRIPTMGSFDKLIGSFKELGRKWLNISPPTNRLAFGGVLLMPVPDLETGYSEISNFIPDVIIPKDSSDFLLQINRPRVSTTGVGDMKINRLTKWSVMRSELIEFTLKSGAAPLSAGGHPIGFAGRLELDINTPADFSGEIPKNKILDVFKELVDLGTEISVEGIVP